MKTLKLHDDPVFKNHWENLVDNTGLPSLAEKTSVLGHHLWGQSSLRILTLFFL